MWTYFKDIAYGAVTALQSMWISFKHLFMPTVTLQYPTVKWNLPDRSRSRLFNKIEDCIGDGACARVCPTKCIEFQAEKRGKDEPQIFTSDGTPIKMRTYVYDIDMTRCCYCGICTFHCNTHSLVMTREYEYSVYEKEDHIYHFAVDKPLYSKSPKESETPKS